MRLTMGGRVPRRVLERLDRRHIEGLPEGIIIHLINRSRRRMAPFLKTWVVNHTNAPGLGPRGGAEGWNEWSISLTDYDRQ
jgi:hypothetical protein